MAQGQRLRRRRPWPGAGHGRPWQGRMRERGAPPVLQVTAAEMDPSGLATAVGPGYWSRRMKLGVAIFPTDYSIRPDDFARACEERGFESVWFPEHTHIPASRATPYPAGGDLPKEYWHTHDPFVALMAAAAVTKTIKLATGICLLIERDPIVTAKEVSSLDQLSGGRVLFGIGAGWNVEEMANHGTDFGGRWTLLRERVEAMKRIWTQEAAE